MFWLRHWMVLVSYFVKIHLSQYFSQHSLVFKCSSLPSLLFTSFLLGFVCPLMWYYATILYFGNYYHKDPRERAGLAASAIAVSVVVFESKFTLVLPLLQ